MSNRKVSLPSSPASKKITINLTHCKYSVLHKVAKRLGWEVTDDEANWDVIWCDAGLGIEKYLRISKSFQRINHFPGMVNIYRKDRLAMSMAKMSKLSPLYNFTPKTWFLPKDHKQIANYLRGGSRRCVIMKPSTGAQGRGIALAMKPEQIISSEEHYIVQSYLHRPFLVDGYKFDLRIYVLVISCDPLRVLLFREGLCRFCTSPYQHPHVDNLSNAFMHLTNYSINKHNEDFVQPDRPEVACPSDESTTPPSPEQSKHSSKRSISWLRSWLRSNGYDDDKLWRQIADIVVKTIISAQAPVVRAFRSTKVNGINKNPFSCFELLGLDIILDEQCTPHLLEVNHMPSFSTDSPLDYEIKFSLITNVFHLLNISRQERLLWQRASAMQSQARLYGDLFDAASKSGKGSDEISSCWSRYLDNEAHNLGHFDLVYPTDVYPAQPTHGRQGIYDELLARAEVMFQGGNADFVIKPIPVPVLSPCNKEPTIMISDDIGLKVSVTAGATVKEVVDPDDSSRKLSRFKPTKPNTRMKQHKKLKTRVPLEEQDAIMLLYHTEDTIYTSYSKKSIRKTKKGKAASVDLQAEPLPNIPRSISVEKLEEARNCSAAEGNIPDSRIGEKSKREELQRPTSEDVAGTASNGIVKSKHSHNNSAASEKLIGDNSALLGSIFQFQPSPPPSLLTRSSFPYLSPQRKMNSTQQESELQLVSPSHTADSQGNVALEDNGNIQKMTVGSGIIVNKLSQDSIYSQSVEIIDNIITGRIAIISQFTPKIASQPDSTKSEYDSIKNEHNGISTNTKLTSAEPNIPFSKSDPPLELGHEVKDDIDGNSENFVEFDGCEFDYYTQDEYVDTAYQEDERNSQEEDCGDEEVNEEEDEVDYFYYDQDPDLYICCSYEDDDENDGLQGDEYDDNHIEEEKDHLGTEENGNFQMEEINTSDGSHNVASIAKPADYDRAILQFSVPLLRSFEGSVSSDPTSQQPKVLSNESQEKEPDITQQQSFIYRYSRPQLHSPLTPQPSMTSASPLALNSATSSTIPAMGSSLSSLNASVLLSSSFHIDADFRSQYESYRAQYIATLPKQQQQQHQVLKNLE